jgi:prepilin-type processing-associated H-X9-DG protein
VNLWVFVDEHPDSINDGFLVTDVEQSDRFRDLPASYHNQACGFGFADGHTELHKWREASTCLPVSQSFYAGNVVGNSNADLKWLIAHTSARSGVSQ